MKGTREAVSYGCRQNRDRAMIGGHGIASATPGLHATTFPDSAETLISLAVQPLGTRVQHVMDMALGRFESRPPTHLLARQLFVPHLLSMHGLQAAPMGGRALGGRRLAGVNRLLVERYFVNCLSCNSPGQLQEAWAVLCEGGRKCRSGQFAWQFQATTAQPPAQQTHETPGFHTCQHIPTAGGFSYARSGLDFTCSASSSVDLSALQ